MAKLIKMRKEIIEFKKNGGCICIKSDMLHCDNVNIESVTTWAMHYMNNMQVEFVEYTMQGTKKFMTVYLENISDLESALLDCALEVTPNLVIRNCSVTPSGKIIEL